MSGLKENSTEKVPLSIEKLRKKVYIFGVRSLNPLGVTLAPLQSIILQNVFTFFIVVERSNRPLSIFLEGYFNVEM